MNIHLILAHGWACQPDYFKPLIQALLEESSKRNLQITSWKIEAQDQGYFQKRIDLSLHSHESEASSQDTLCLAIGHSLGFARLIARKIPADAWVSLGGFTFFAQDNPAKLQALESMIKGLKRSPETVLQHFYRQGKLNKLNFQTPLSPTSIQALRDDLIWMKTLDYQAEIDSMQAPLLALASDSDDIVPLELSQACFNQRKHSLVMISDPKLGHQIGYANALFCAQHILDFLIKQDLIHLA